jgi:hypothetical protein
MILPLPRPSERPRLTIAELSGFPQRGSMGSQVASKSDAVHSYYAMGRVKWIFYQEYEVRCRIAGRTARVSRLGPS